MKKQSDDRFWKLLAEYLVEQARRVETGSGRMLTPEELDAAYQARAAARRRRRQQEVTS